MKSNLLFTLIVALVAALALPLSTSFAKSVSKGKSKSSSKDMTLDGIAKELADREKMAPAQVKAILDQFFQDMTSHLKSGKKVKILGFGTFYASKHEAKVWTNPRTKKVVNVPSRFTVRFRPSVKLKEKMNKSEEPGKVENPAKTPEQPIKTAEKADSGKKS